jgi:hypothetical protein
MGGLGNQLFQIFTTIAYALEHNLSFIFLNQFQLNSGNDGATIRYSYWNTFLQSLRPFLRDNLYSFTTIKEPDFTYNKLPALTNNNTNIELFGHFQSYKYFQSYKTTITKLLKLDTLKKSLLDKLNLDFKNTQYISIHFRLGDYKKLQNHYIILPIEYYINSLQHIISNISNNKNITVIYFCEQSDLPEVLEMIHILKNKFVSLDFVNYNNKLLVDWEELLLMSCCNYNIIANSTFSWWAGYLNNNANNIICYPCKWFGPLLSNKNSITDLFPLTWNCVSFS